MTRDPEFETMTESTNDIQNKKRKKRRSAMQIAKKCARQRHHEDLDPETYQYMVRILELIRNEFPQMEDKTLFVNNVFEQTIGREVEYARNQIGSRILDSLIKHASLEVIQRLVDAFQTSLRPMSSDKFASHVLENIILVCAERGTRLENSEKISIKKTETVCIQETDVPVYNNITLKLSKYFVNNVEEFIWDVYANHLLRTVIECLGGLIDTLDEQGKKIVLSGVERRTVITEYTELLISSCQRLHKWPQFITFGKDELTSGLIQSVLYSIKDIDSKMTKVFIKKITEECFAHSNEDNLSNIFDNSSSIRLLEVCLFVAKPKTFTRIYKNFFAGNMRQLSLTRNANFSVQRLLDYCTVKEEFEEIFKEITPHISEILISNHTGILTSLGNACLRMQTQQGTYIQTILDALKCNVSAEKQSFIVLCLCALINLKCIEDLKNAGKHIQVQLHGSLVVQAMLNFNKPIKIVNSLLSVDNDELIHIFADPRGSRIIDAFMDSKYIGEKSREKMLKKLQGNWVQLVQSVHGSRVLDKVWEKSRESQKYYIMEELAAAGEALRSTKSSKIIFMKLNVPLFTKNKKEWAESQGKEEKTRKLFEDIIGVVPQK